MKITHKTVILTLAAISLLVVPALSNRGIAGIHHGGWMPLVDDLTEEELGSMTLAEIKDLKDQKMQELQNMTPAEIRKLREQKCEQARQELENFRAHMPGTFSQQLRSPWQGLIFSFLVKKRSTSAPASLIPIRKGSRIKAVFPLSM